MSVCAIAVSHDPRAKLLPRGARGERLWFAGTHHRQVFTCARHGRFAPVNVGSRVVGLVLRVIAVRLPAFLHDRFRLGECIEQSGHALIALVFCPK